jgi:hypothetical protein
MKYLIIYSPFVFEEIKQANFFYNSKKVGLKNEFKQNVKSELKTILSNPYLYEVKYDTTRIAFIEKFPFGIHFQILEDKNVILVKAFFHTSRNPNDWKNR